MSLPASAEVDSKIHKPCIEAKDYAGYFRAIKGEIVPSEKLILAISIRLSLRIQEMVIVRELDADMDGG